LAPFAATGAKTTTDTVRRTEVEIEDEKGRTHPASADTTKRDESV
jgi:hypothetical protein